MRVPAEHRSVDKMVGEVSWIMADGSRQTGRATGIALFGTVVAAIAIGLLVGVVAVQDIIGRWPSALLMVIIGATAGIMLIRHRQMAYQQHTQEAVMQTSVVGPSASMGLPASDQRFRELLESLPRVAVQGYDSQRRVIYWNEASERLYGFSEQEARGRCLEALLIPDEMADIVVDAHHAWVNHGTQIPASELELKHKSGAPVPVFSHHVMLGERSDNPLMFCIDIDLAGERKVQRELDYMTRFDPLTELPNRQTFETELENMLGECQRHGDTLMVLFLDIDHFTEINDTQGYEMGDLVIRSVASRLQGFQRSQDLLSRFGGDEFVMAMPRLDYESDALSVVQRIREDFQRPFQIEGRELLLRLSIGVSLYPENGNDAPELVRNADVAKHRAKQAGRDGYQFFNQEVRDAMLHQHHLAGRLQTLLSEDGGGELFLHFQPQVAARSERIESVEALMRWHAPEGPIPPTDFIKVAERTNLIERLGDWVIRQACRQQAEWHAMGIKGYRIDINISGRQAINSDVFQRLEACVAEYGLTPRDIGIELTENVLIDADVKVRDSLRALHDRGYKIAIDDFGTGYSSMSYLKMLPVTALKIDRSFVIECAQEPKDRAIMEATVFLGHRLGLEVVAEGVENIQQLELLREMRCDLIQGYYFYKPMAAADIQRLLSGGNNPPHPGAHRPSSDPTSASNGCH